MWAFCLGLLVGRKVYFHGLSDFAGYEAFPWQFLGKKLMDGKIHQSVSDEPVHMAEDKAFWRDDWDLAFVGDK